MPENNFLQVLLLFSTEHFFLLVKRHCLQVRVGAWVGMQGVIRRVWGRREDTHHKRVKFVKQ